MDDPLIAALRAAAKEAGEMIDDEALDWLLSAPDAETFSDLGLYDYDWPECGCLDPDEWCRSLGEGWPYEDRDLPDDLVSDGEDPVSSRFMDDGPPE